MNDLRTQKHRLETAGPWQAGGSQRCIRSRRKDSATVAFLRAAVHALLTGLLLAALPAVAQQKSDAEKLSEALKEIEALKTRLNELEGVVQSLGAKPAPAPPAAEAKDTGFVKWNELVAGKSRFKLYGFLRGDAIYDDSRPGGNGANSSLVPVFILSENGLGGAANLAPNPNAQSFAAHPRLTRLGLDFTGPEIESLRGARTGGKLEVDFYNLVAGAAESREFLRMRHAYASLKWDAFYFHAGQSADLVSQYWPVVNPDFGGMWGAGNLGDRRPQFRADWTPKLGSGVFFLQGMAGLTGADDVRDLDANGIRDGEASGLPTLQGRIGYRLPVWNNQPLEIAAWIHHARERVDAPAPGTFLSGRRSFSSDGYGVELVAPLYKDLVSLKGELWTGKNLDDVRGGILQGINVTTGQEIDATGGWIELSVKPARWCSLHGGFLTDNPSNSDLPAQAPDLNSIWYVAGRLYFDPIEIGLDYLNWTTYFKDTIGGGTGKGQDNRFQAYISYKF